MHLAVVRMQCTCRLDGDGELVELANRYLNHLESRSFSAATVRAYAYDLLNFGRFLDQRGLSVRAVQAADVFDYLDWQARPPRTASESNVIRLAGSHKVAASTMNRRIAAVRGLFSYAFITGVIDRDPMPAARRSSGLRAAQSGLLGHLGPGRGPRGDGRLVRQPQRLPESLPLSDVTAFVADLQTHRDRAIALLMLLGGLRSVEVRTLALADVDMALGQVRVIGKGSKERVVPVDDAFFRECASYLRRERPDGCATKECFVVLRGPTTGKALSEAGLRKVFRAHRASSGATRVRPHRLRHTYATELVNAGVDLAVLRELMGHSSLQSSMVYVHVSPAKVAAEYAAAKAVIAR